MFVWGNGPISTPKTLTKKGSPKKPHLWNGPNLGADEG